MYLSNEIIASNFHLTLATVQMLEMYLFLVNMFDNINNQYNTSNLFINERSLWTFGTEKPKYKKTMSGKKDFPVVKSELDWQKELSQKTIWNKLINFL